MPLINEGRIAVARNLFGPSYRERLIGLEAHARVMLEQAAAILERLKSRAKLQETQKDIVFVPGTGLGLGIEGLEGGGLQTHGWVWRYGAR